MDSWIGGEDGIINNKSFSRNEIDIFLYYPKFFDILMTKTGEIF